MFPEILINGRTIGRKYKPFVIAEIGINHGGDFNKAKKMVKDAQDVGTECVKFQCHILEEEMIKNDIVPENANESIWDIIKKCSLSEKEEFELKNYTESLGMIYLSTPFSKTAVDRLEQMNIHAYKIGSGECNNIPLLKYVASFGKPILLSTGMNDLESICESVKVIEDAGVKYAILHATSLYPTPYNKVRLGAIQELAEKFPKAVLGLSDHSIGNYACFAAVALGASILEKHFTSEKKWLGPDIPISINPNELHELIIGSNAIHNALGGKKTIVDEERLTSNFAFASVVATKNISKGEKLTEDNIWVKRPGDGEIQAKNYFSLLGKKANQEIKKDSQIKWNMIDE